MKNLNLGENTETGFKVPESYFDDLEDRIMLRVHQPEVIQLHPRNKITGFLTSAAAVLLLALLIPAINLLTSKDASSDIAAIEDYLHYHPTVSDEEIVELLSAEELSQIEYTTYLNQNDLEDALPSHTNLENLIY